MDVFSTAFLLFLVLDPIGNIPAFLAILQNVPAPPASGPSGSPPCCWLGPSPAPSWAGGEESGRQMEDPLQSQPGSFTALRSIQEDRPCATDR